MPRDLKIEHSSPLAALSDEQLALMIADLELRIATRLSGGEAKVINEGPATEFTARPPKGQGRAGLLGRVTHKIAISD